LGGVNMTVYPEFGSPTLDDKRLGHIYDLQY
jgi:hypothetical protein